jgi:hypothetical protein
MWYGGASLRSARWAGEHPEYVHILTDIATKLGPALGWQRG